MEEREVILKGRLDGKGRNRLKRLLDMEYKPSELAEELGIELNQIYRVYLPMGCPNNKEDQRRILINGKHFKEWYLANFKKATIEQDETFCKTCKNAVPIVQPSIQKKDKMTYILSTCPNCGRKLAKIIECNKKNDQ